MELIDIKELQPYVTVPVQIGVQDEQGDKAPLMHKVIQQAKMCPDGTHIRLYFDRHNFLAVPKTSFVVKNEQQWTAFDEETQLYYIVRKEDRCHD